jgi:hypothetical protein
LQKWRNLALVAAILLGLAGLDALDADPERQPPHRELGETEEGDAGKGGAVACADGEGQTEVLESRLKTLKANSSLVVARAWQLNRSRLAESLMVSG